MAIKSTVAGSCGIIGAFHVRSPLSIPIIIVSNWKGFLGEEITELTRPDAPLLDDPEFAAAWEHGRIIAVIGNDEPTGTRSLMR
jgi:hypothetical protein